MVYTVPLKPFVCTGVSLKGYLVPNYDLDEPAPPKRKHTKRTTSQEAVNATDSDFEKLTIGDSSNEEEWSEYIVVITLVVQCVCVCVCVGVCVCGGGCGLVLFIHHSVSIASLNSHNSCYNDVDDVIMIQCQ